MPFTELLVDEILLLRREGAGAGGGARAIRLAERAARLACPVLIEGEPGTGGEALARAIHQCGDRRDRPFVRMHAGGHSGDVGAALFGLAGPAGDRQPGYFAQAQGGTLLIQGIEDLPLEVQGAVLRAIRDGEIHPTGAKRPVRTDARVVATSHADLAERVRAGRFREDLYYRLHVLPITLAPLRACRTDIPGLAHALVAGFARQEGKRLSGVAPDAMALLQAYDWPGNHRQLENAIFRAVVLAEGGSLGPSEFPQIAAQVAGFGVVIPPVPPACAPARESHARAEVRPPNALDLLGEEGEVRPLADLEAEIIRFALAHYRGRMSAISRHLGIGRSTLYRKLKDLGLENLQPGVAA